MFYFPPGQTCSSVMTDFLWSGRARKRVAKIKLGCVLWMGFSCLQVWEQVFVMGLLWSEQFLLEVSRSVFLCVSVLLNMPPALFLFLLSLPKKTVQIRARLLWAECAPRSPRFIWCHQKMSGCFWISPFPPWCLVLYFWGFDNTSCKRAAQRWNVKAVRNLKQFHPNFVTKTTLNQLVCFLWDGTSMRTEGTWANLFKAKKLKGLNISPAASLTLNNI